MADFLNYTPEDRKKIAQGLLPLVPGAPEGAADAIAGMSDDGVTAQINFAKQIVDGNVAPPAKRRGFLAMLRGEEPEPPEDGARDKLRKLVDRERTGDRLTDPKQVQTLESALAAAGYKVGLNSNISDQERGYLDAFYTQLGNGMSLNSIFTANTETYQAEADAAAQAQADAAAAEAQATADAQSQADMYKQYEAGLVYAGYLDPKDVGNPSAAAEALSGMVSNVSRSNTPADELRSMFANIDSMEPNAKALDFIREHSLANNTSVRLEQDLESGDPAQIERAQAYMRLNGVQVGGEDVQINGLIYSQDFKNVAEGMIRQPITAPEGTGPNGTLNIREIYAVSARDQLYVSQAMMEALSPGEREAAMMYPEAKDAMGGGMTREGFVATRLLAQDPAKYEALLAADNAARAGATLDVPVEFQEIAVPAGTTLEEERIDIAQNPAGLRDIEGGDAVVDVTQPIADVIAEHGQGVTSNMGYVVFDGKEVGLEGVAEALKLAQNNDGADLTMQRVFSVVQEAVTGRADMPISIWDDVQPVTEMLGMEIGHRLNPQNPQDMATMLTGASMYAGMVAGRLEGKFEPELPREDVAAAIKNVAGLDGSQPLVAPQAPAPDEPAQKGWLMSTFERFGLMTPAQAATPQGPANSPEAPAAANTASAPRQQEPSLVVNGPQ